MGLHWLVPGPGSAPVRGLGLHWFRQMGTGSATWALVLGPGSCPGIKPNGNMSLCMQSTTSWILAAVHEPTGETQQKGQKRWEHRVPRGKTPVVVLLEIPRRLMHSLHVPNALFSSCLPRQHHTATHMVRCCRDTLILLTNSADRVSARRQILQPPSPPGYNFGDKVLLTQCTRSPPPETNSPENNSPATVRRQNLQPETNSPVTVSARRQILQSQSPPGDKFSTRRQILQSQSPPGDKFSSDSLHPETNSPPGDKFSRHSLRPETNSPVTVSTLRQILHQETISPATVSAQRQILHPETNSPVTVSNRRQILQSQSPPRANSPAGDKFSSHSLHLETKFSLHQARQIWNCTAVDFGWWCIY
jgi:hypothetical protein